MINNVIKIINTCWSFCQTIICNIDILIPFVFAAVRKMISFNSALVSARTPAIITIIFKYKLNQLEP